MSEREWREASDMKPSTLALLLVVAVGFTLRVWHVGTGMPLAVVAGEPAVMSAVVQMLKSGDFNPHVFECPTGYVYLQLGVALIGFLSGAVRHAWSAVEQVGAADFYVWGRICSAAIGTATILLLHQVGMRWGARHALLAAGLFAVMPLHVLASHVVVPDAPLVFAVTLTLLLSLRAIEKPATLAFVLAGAAAGLSAGLEYNGFSALVMPIGAALMAGAGRGRGVTDSLAVLTGCVGAFFITTPYALLDLPHFLNGFGAAAQALAVGQPDPMPSWLAYLQQLVATFQWPAFIMAISGMVLSVVRMFRGPMHYRWVLLVLFPAVFFQLIAGWPLRSDGYVLPMVPFMCLCAAIATISGVSLLRRFDIPRVARTTLIVGLTVAALLPPLVRSIRQVRAFGTTTTQAVSPAAR